MYIVAGIPIWLALGALIGFFAGKVTRTSGPYGFGANVGVCMTTAVLAGFITTVVANGEKTGSGLLLSIVLAAIVALLSIVVFRIIFPTRSPRFEDSSTNLG